MEIEIWSDIVCGWCYLGKRRLERALERFDGRDDVRGFKTGVGLGFSW